jgi:hypothetical protein
MSSRKSHCFVGRDKCVDISGHYRIGAGDGFGRAQHRHAGGHRLKLAEFLEFRLAADERIGIEFRCSHDGVPEQVPTAR